MRVKLNILPTVCVLLGALKSKFCIKIGSGVKPARRSRITTLWYAYFRVRIKRATLTLAQRRRLSEVMLVLARDPLLSLMSIYASMTSSKTPKKILIWHFPNSFITFQAQVKHFWMLKMIKYQITVQFPPIRVIPFTFRTFKVILRTLVIHHLVLNIKLSFYASLMKWIFPLCRIIRYFRVSKLVKL